jgi:uncharacterized phage protein gp47/JayE
MKTAEEIYARMLETFSQKTEYDLSDSSDLAIRLYAAAAQISALYAEMDYVKKQSFPQTASGGYLDYHAKMRGIARTEATSAAGTIRFSISAALDRDVVIAAGTVCMTSSGISFATTAEGTIAAGALYADVAARAEEAGASGNAAAGSITRMSSAPAYVSGCVNQLAFSGGAEAEDDESLRTRILESYSHLPNGANAEYYRQTALNHDGVAEAYVAARARGTGTADVYVSASDGLPSDALLSEIQSDLEGKREIAADIRVLAPTTKTVDVEVSVKVSSNADFAAVKAAVESGIRKFFSGKLLCAPIYRARIGQIIFAAEGVENYTIISPSADIAGEAAVLPVLGTLTVSEA